MDGTPAHKHFFIYPQVQKHDEIHTVLVCMEAFRQSLDETNQVLIGSLISYAEAHSSQSHLLPHLTPFEFVLFAMLIEQQRELANQKKTSHEPGHDFTHPPFP